MIDRREYRNRFAINLAANPRLIPPLADGSRTVVVVFNDDNVGSCMRRIWRDYSGHAHIVILGTTLDPVGILSVAPSEQEEVSRANTLQSEITFGVLLTWIKSNHDGGPLQFIFADSPVVAITEDDMALPA